MSEPHDDPRVLPPDGVDDETARAYGRQLAMDGLLQELLREQPAAAPRKTGSSSRLRRRSSILIAVDPPRRFWTVHRTAAAVALLLVLSSFALLVTNDRSDTARPAQQAVHKDEERRQTLLREMADWEEALSAMHAPETGTAKGDPTNVVSPAAPGELSNPLPKADADEGTRFIEARRDFVLQQLRRFEPRRPQTIGADDEESLAPKDAARPGSAITQEERPEVGQVLAAEEAGENGRLIRQTGGVEQRLPLTQGAKIRQGDRIEIPGQTERSRASVALDGGATLALDQNTVVEVLGRDALRLQTGRIYAHISVPHKTSDQESAPPFSLQTDNCRFLAQEVRAEIFTSAEMTPPQSGARVEQGKVHLVNRKGHVVGGKGQEVRATADTAPTRSEGYSAAIWNGMNLPANNLPFSAQSPVVYSSATPSRTLSGCYALALAHRSEVQMAGLQVALGNSHQEALFRQLVKDAIALQQAGIRGIPPPVLGAVQPLRAPPSGKLEDTRPEQTAAVLQIQAAAKTATAAIPTVFVCGGTATDLASAWLLDHTLSERVVLLAPYGAKGDAWWKQDSWAAEIILRRFRCVFVSGAALSVEQNRLDRITDPRWSALLRKEREVAADWDFRLLEVLTAEPERKVNRIRFVGFHHERPAYEADPEGRIWRVRDTNEADFQREFDRIFLSPPVR